MKPIRTLLLAALGAFTLAFSSSARADEAPATQSTVYAASTDAAAYLDGQFSALLEAPSAMLNPVRLVSLRDMANTARMYAAMFALWGGTYGAAFFTGRASAFDALADLNGEPL